MTTPPVRGFTHEELNRIFGTTIYSVPEDVHRSGQATRYLYENHGREVDTQLRELERGRARPWNLSGEDRARIVLAWASQTARENRNARASGGQVSYRARNAVAALVMLATSRDTRTLGPGGERIRAAARDAMDDVRDELMRKHGLTRSQADALLHRAAGELHGRAQGWEAQYVASHGTTWFRASYVPDGGVGPAAASGVAPSPDPIGEVDGAVRTRRSREVAIEAVKAETGRAQQQRIIRQDDHRQELARDHVERVAELRSRIKKEEIG